MRTTVQKYISQYIAAGLVFGAAIFVERFFNLPQFTLWLLIYMVVRRVSFKIIFLLSLFADLASSRLLGLSGVFLSLIFMVNSYILGRRFWVWLVSLGLLSLLEYVQSGGIPAGFVLVSVIFAPLFLFGFNLKHFRL